MLTCFGRHPERKYTAIGEFSYRAEPKALGPMQCPEGTAGPGGLWGRVEPPKSM